MFSMPPRRIAAVVLPRLLCELASGRGGAARATRGLGVVRVELDVDAGKLTDRAVLDAVDERARRVGLRAGMTIAEARAYLAALEVRAVTQPQVRRALEHVAEVAMAFGPTVSVGSPDVVWVDLTGAAHLAGGEEQVARELSERVGQLDHVARVVISDGPRIAAMLGRHAVEPATVIAPGQSSRKLHALPVTSLPLDEETSGWLIRVGVLTLGDLAKLPRAQLTSRLGERAPEVLSLVAGHDPEPLTAYEPARVVSEEATWEEPVELQASLVFVLQRLVSRIAARLEGRGEATRALELVLRGDKGIARLRGVEPDTRLRVELPAPLSHADDLLRALRARLESAELAAPALSMQLEAQLVTRAPRVQLDLSRDVHASPDALPVLLAELSAEIGPDRFGVLAIRSSYRPEARSALVPLAAHASQRRSLPNPPCGGAGASLTRLLPLPQSLGSGRVAPGHLVACPAASAFEVARVQFDVRLDGVEWWTRTPVDRDYVRVWMTSGSGGTGWIYTDRSTGESWLHGWFV